MIQNDTVLYDVHRSFIVRNRTFCSGTNHWRIVMPMRSECPLNVRV